MLTGVGRDLADMCNLLERRLSNKSTMRRLAFLSLVLGIACRGSARSIPPAPALATSPVDNALPAGELEGRVLDSKTSGPVPGVMIFAFCHGADLRLAITDETGQYRLGVPAGTCNVDADVGTAAITKTVEVVDSGPTHLDLELDHAELLQALRDEPPDHCPGSRPGDVVLGHTTSQADIDALASVVLARIVAGQEALADQGTSTTYVVGELRGGQRLGPAALPQGTSRTFVLKTRAEVQAEADRSGAEINYLDFESIYSDGTCALVRGGGDFVIPSSKRFVTKQCCCTGTEIYEKQNGRWVFVRRVHEICA